MSSTKYKKFVRIGSLVVEIIKKIVLANCINFGKIGHLKNMSCMRDIRGPIITILPSRIKKPMSKYYVMAKNNYVSTNVY